jgi:hypothetical protein
VERIIRVSLKCPSGVKSEHPPRGGGVVSGSEVLVV